MTKYFNFYGSASRQEYWAVMVIMFAGLIVLSTVFSLIMLSGSSGLVIGSLLMIALGVASIWLQFAVSARRCRDAMINPWWSLALLVPYVNLAVLIVFGVLPPKGEPEGLVS